jgi:tRNA threonylcarbamoyladenosine biosynthesis protein TsaB
MSLILNIDTSSTIASVSLAVDGKILSQKINEQVCDHATWLHEAIRNIIECSNYSLKQLSAVAVVAGPGSYTGLRVGMATAKGLCFTANIALISINTLELMAFAIKENHKVNDIANESSFLLCPMIDARRMEVFTALYDNELREIMAPTAMILSDHSFDVFLEKNQIVFFGNGSLKLESVKFKKNLSFSDYNYTTKDVALLTYKKLSSFCFTNLAYSEPFYLKDFYFHQKNG